MALATQHFDLYIIPNTTPPPVLDISQYDTSRTFVGHVKDIHGKQYSLPNNTTALLEGRNGNGIIFRLNVTVSGDTLTFTPDDILTDTSGRIHATISLDSIGQQLSPLRIIFNVQRAGITKEERTTNPDFKDAVAAAFQAYIDEHGSGGGGGSGEMNVQSDWNQGNINADDYIKNKPTKLSQFQNDSGFITSGQIPTELPAVTSSDNGKVLGVSNGAWDKITPSSGSGIPTGGSVGQVLTKTSSGSTWSDVPTELPSGGSTGQVLKKTSSGVAWQNESSGGSSITVDSALSTTSTNPVQNKIITNAINAKGTYSKPSGGIPKTDLASAVQTSLGKADTALQTPSSYTNGQVLMVQNGSWVASNPPTELPSDGSVGQVLKRTASGVEWGNEQGGSGGSLPSGGTTGQVLTKTASGSTWADAPEELPSGGTTGQVLKKTASGVAWQNESSGSSSTAFEIPISETQNGYSTTATAAEIIANAKNCYISQGNFIFKNTAVHYSCANEVTISFSNSIGFRNLPLKGYIIQANTTNNTITITPSWVDNPYEIPLVYNNNTNTWQVDPSANFAEIGVFQNYDNCVFVINDRKLPVVRALRDDSEDYAELIAVDYINGSNSCEQTIWKVIADNQSSSDFEVSVNTYSISPYLIRVYLNSATFVYEVDETPLELISVCENCEVLFESRRYKHSYTDKISSSEVIMHFIAGTDGGSEGFIIHAIVGSGVTISWVDNMSLPSGGSNGQVLKKTAAGVAWANESGGSGSGSGAFEIPVTSTTSGGVTTYSTTATFAEIMANMPNLIVHYTNSNLYYPLSYTATSDPNSWYMFVFSAQQPNTGVLETEWLFVECANNTVTIAANSLDVTGLPAVSSTDNGKFLRVVNGVWTAQTVQTWQGGNY